MNQYELQHSWSTHRLLGPSGDAWKPRLRQTHSFSCGCTRLHCLCSCYAAGSPRLASSFPKSILWATNLSLHWSKEDLETALHGPAVLRAAAADKMQAFRTFWLSFGRLSLQWTLLWVINFLLYMKASLCHGCTGEGDFKRTDTCQSWTEVWNVGSSEAEKWGNATKWKGSNEVNSTTEWKTERKWGRKVRETERETDIQRFPFTHCFPRVIPHPPRERCIVSSSRRADIYRLPSVAVIIFSSRCDSRPAVSAQ